MKKNLLIIGDICILAIITFIGFTTHGQASISFLPRMAATYFPLIISWFAIAPWFGLFNPEITSDFKQLWLPALAMLFAGPLAVLVRGLILNADIIPIFGVVFSSTSAIGMIFWRAIYIWLSKRMN